MTALARGNNQLFNHIMEVHSGVIVELTGNSCFESYCSCRESLLGDLLVAEMQEILSSEESLELRVRKAILLCVDVCDKESEDYLSFFCTDIKDKQQVATVRSSPAFNNAIR